MVNEKGVPDTVTPGDCDADLEAPTIAAARQWRFRPAWEKGKPVRAETELTATAVASKGG
jgi:hypothetical protein